MLRSLNGSCHLRGRLPLKCLPAGAGTSARQRARQTLVVASGTCPPPENISGAPSAPVPPVALPPHRRHVDAIVADSGHLSSYDANVVDDPVVMSAAWRERSGWRGWKGPDEEIFWRRASATCQCCRLPSKSPRACPEPRQTIFQREGASSGRTRAATATPPRLERSRQRQAPLHELYPFTQTICRSVYAISTKSRWASITRSMGL